MDVMMTAPLTKDRRPVRSFLSLLPFTCSEAFVDGRRSSLNALCQDKVEAGFDVRKPMFDYRCSITDV